MDLNKLLALWTELGDIPVNAAGEIETPFQQFEAGTPREDIWHWFEDQNQRFLVGEIMTGKRPTPITAGVNKYPVYDRHGVQVCLGDTLQAQVTDGPYGRTASVGYVVDQAHAMYCQFNTKNHVIPLALRYDLHSQPVMVAHRIFEDFEHGHECWAEITQRATAQ